MCPSEGRRRRAPARNAASSLSAILGAYGLDYSDDPSGVTAVMSDRKGSVSVVRGLAEVWVAAERSRAPAARPARSGSARPAGRDPPVSIPIVVVGGFLGSGKTTLLRSR